MPFTRNSSDRVFLGVFTSKPIDSTKEVHFSTDDDLTYDHFFADFGPLNLGKVLNGRCLLRTNLKSRPNSTAAVLRGASLTTVVPLL